MPPGRSQFWREQRRALHQSAVLVRVFYASVLFILLLQHPNWDEWIRLEQLRLLWPVGWMQWTGVRPAVVAVLIFSVASVALASFAPERRWTRALAFVGLLQFSAFWNSWGFIGHGWHGWLWISFLLIFLPDGSVERISRSTGAAQTYLRVFWSAQAAILFFYTLSGLFKLAAAALQAAQGQVHALHPHALATHIAYRLLEAGDPGSSYLGHHIVEHPWIGWPFLLTAIYLETCSLLVAFRPGVQRLWGAGLILLHAGVYLTLNISFVWQVYLVALMLLASPFAPPSGDWREATGRTLRELPLLGDLWRLLRPATAVGWRHGNRPNLTHQHRSEVRHDI